MTNAQSIKQLEKANNLNPGTSITLFEIGQLREQTRVSWFDTILTAYNLGYLRGEAARTKRKPC